MKTILVGLDGSERAPSVLERAINLARTEAAKLILLRAYHVPQDLMLAWPADDAPLEGAVRHSVVGYLDAMAQTVPPELLAGLRIAPGAPWKVVCDVARQENVDLVVIGSHGYAGIDRLLGTTASKIVNHADRSVLVVR